MYDLLIDKKTWNAGPVMLNGKQATSFGVGWDHYLDSSKKWMGIDCCLSNIASGFEMEKAPFYVKFPDRSTGYMQMIINNRFDVFNKTEITASEFNSNIKCLGVEDVQGQLFDINGNGRNDAVFYPGAYASTFFGDLIMFTEHGRAPRLKKLVRFNNAPSTDIAIEFEIEYSGKPELTPRSLKEGEIRIEERDKWETNLGEGDYLYLNSNTQKNDGLYVRAWDEPHKRGMGIKKPLIWDSSVDEFGLPRIQTIEAYIKWVSGNKYKLIKIIPKSFFTGAVYPVYTDTTSTFYPDPDPETTSVDGFAGVTGQNTSFHNLVIHAGNAAGDSSATASAISLRTRAVLNVWRQLLRGLILFDTSAIPDGDSLTSGIFSIWSTAKADPLSANPDLNLYSSNPASNTSLVGTDFSTVGNTPFSTAIPYASIAVGGFNNFTLNPSGLAAVSKTDITKYSIRNANYDVADSSPPWVSDVNDFITFGFAEQAGTDQDPKLVIVHAPAIIGIGAMTKNLGFSSIQSYMPGVNR